VDSPPSLAPDHPDLKVVQWEKSSKVRKTYLFTGISPEADIKCYNNTILGMERALKERLFYIPTVDGGWQHKPTHEPGVIKIKMRRFLDAMKPLSVYTHPWNRKCFALSYTGQKRERYLKAASQLDAEGLLAEDCWLKFFMKFELFNNTSKPNPSPRGINPPSDKYLVEFGRYIKPVEHVIYKAVETVFGYTVIVKGLNQTERGRLIEASWRAFDEPVAIMLDASKFEQSVSAECIDFEYDLYSQYYKGDKLFRYMMRQQRSYKGKARSTNGKLSFKVSGVRASGMNNTALGNCVISAGFAFDILSIMQAKDSSFGFRVHVDGDDVVVIMSKVHAESFRVFAKEYYREAGFRMKMEATVDIIEHIDFCQSRPVFDGVGYVMIRNMKASLAKDAVSRKPLDNNKIFEKWSAAVGAGGISCTGGIPVHQSFYSCILRASRGAKPLTNDPVQRSQRYKTRGMTRSVMDIHPVTRCSYWLAFGILPDAQECIEKILDEYSIVHGVPEDELIKHLTLPWGHG